MQKQARFSGWLLVAGLLSGGSAAAQTPGSAPLAVQPNQVGAAAAVFGQVGLTRPQAVGRNIKSGEAIFLGDTITTDAQGRLQILLLDETVFTIGPNSAMVIDEFVYDPSTDAGKVSAQIVKGVFRFVSGRIAHKNPEQMKVKLPAGTIGVRGTIVVGRVEGNRSTVALVGPGSFTVTNPVGNGLRSVEVSRVGFATTISGANMAPTSPGNLPQADLSAISQSLGPAAFQNAPTPGTSQGLPQAGGPAPGQQGPGGPPQAGGQLSFQGVFGPGNFGPQGPGLPMGPAPAGPGPYGFPGGLPPPPGQFNPNQTQQMIKILDGVALKEQLRLPQGGVFHYHASVPNAFHQTTPFDRFGSLDVDLDINFGQRTVGGGNSRLAVKTLGPSNIDLAIPISSQSFATGDGNAIFTQTTTGLTGNFAIQNAGGQIGGRLKTQAVFDVALRHGEGVVDNIPRSDGPSPAP